MSTTLPPSTGLTAEATLSYHRPGRQQRVNTHRYSQRSATKHYCHNKCSSPSLSDSSTTNYRLENGENVRKPPLLPQRHQQMAPHTNRDSYYCWSDGSGSTRLPTYPEGDDRRSCHTELDQQRVPLHRYDRSASVRCCKYPGRVYPTVGYHPPSGRDSRMVVAMQRPPEASSNVSESPSSVAAYVGGAGGGYVARGCGGRCETCENVCYYLLQVAFAMGIFIGASLCIAGATLRRSPSRQLQVLLYIGALVALVSALLLVVQCRARRQANRYYQQQQRHRNIAVGVTPAPIQQQRTVNGATKLVTMANNTLVYSG